MSERRSRYAIFGKGVSGRAAADLVQSLGGDFVFFDEIAGASAGSLDDLSAFDEYIFSPGIAADHPWRRAVVTEQGRVFSELSFAARHWRGKLIGVTGTNGKTTVTSLLTKVLQTAGSAACEAGNIGIPLSQRVIEFKETCEEVVAVCEISSFQAELTEGLELDGLLWTNFAEDHLDRYVDLSTYFEAKAGLIDCLKPAAPCVIGASVKARLNPAQLAQCEVVAGGCSALAELCADSPFARLPQSENLALVEAFCRKWSVDNSCIETAANTFSLAPHRLAMVMEHDGISFWDDSKATNFEATLAALRSFDIPVIWIGGGQGKGGDLKGFAEALSPLVDCAVLYGAVAAELGCFLRGAGLRPLVFQDFEPAVERAWQEAQHQSSRSGRVALLLSPGFASFDQFPGYAERGKTFLKSLLSLKESDGSK